MKCDKFGIRRTRKWKYAACVAKSVSFVGVWVLCLQIFWVGDSQDHIDSSTLGLLGTPRSYEDKTSAVNTEENVDVLILTEEVAGKALEQTSGPRCTNGSKSMVTVLLPAGFGALLAIPLSVPAVFAL
jgi:hypothetical protein